jgi:DNA-binding transcriptional regulator GbsR (MarR family)
VELQEAKNKFVQAWGTLGTNWGINRTMAQIHALLLITPEALTTEDIMEELNISRGNANMNLRTLIDWGLAMKTLKAGERKEFFIAEKDMWKVFRQIVKERRKRELEPILDILNELSHIQNSNGKPVDKEAEAFAESVEDIRKFASKADNALEKITKADEQWFFSALIKIL